MIDPRALQQFLGRKLDDYSFLKQLERTELLSSLAMLDPAPDTSDLMHHQLVCMLAGIACPTFAFWLGMGTGKTLLVSRLLSYFYKCGMMQKGFVFGPSVDAVYSWARQLEEWKIPIPYVELDDNASVAKAEKALTQEAGLLLLSYPAFTHMVSRRTQVLDAKGQPTGRHELEPHRRALDVVCKGVNAAVFDESTEARNTESLMYRSCRAVSKRVAIRYALAGRPFGRNPREYWPQMYLVDRGATLGENQNLFLSAFFTKKKKYFGGPFSFDYKIDPKKESALTRTLAHRSIRYATTDCIDLPPLHRRVLQIPFPAETLAYYERVKEHMIESARGDRKTMLNDFCHMRQLGSGFLGVKSDHFGAKAEIVFDTNPKLDKLAALVGALPKGRKMVIFHEFIHSGRDICARLRRMGVKHTWLWSGTKDRKAAVAQLDNDPATTVAVVNHMLGAYVLNLQAANYFAYYESPVGCIDRDQSEFRVWRQGQKRTCWLYDLVMIGGIEQRILDFHTDGADIFRALARDPGALFSKRRSKEKPVKRA